MKQFREFAVNTLVGGLLVVAPIYVAVLLLLKAMESSVGLVRPFAMLLPEWVPAENFLSLLLVLLVCFLIGVAVRTPRGRAMRERIETSLFERLPGYALFKSLTQRVAGESEENVWKPALVEIEEALVPAFIIEEHEDGRLHGFRPLGPHASRWSRLYSQPGTRAPPGRPIHTGGQVRLTVGIRFKGSCRSHESKALVMSVFV